MPYYIVDSAKRAAELVEELRGQGKKAALLGEEEVKEFALTNPAHWRDFLAMFDADEFFVVVGDNERLPVSEVHWKKRV